MPSVNVYLAFNGNCEEAFNFYKSVFGGEFSGLNRYSEMPSPEGGPQITDEMKNLILHISLPISKETMLMGSDTAGEWAMDFQQGNNFSVYVDTENKAEADRIFNALASGGNITMPIDNTFWGSYFGSLTDKFGINWMIGFG